MPRVTATSLAAHAHFQCDLYIHQAYHGVFPRGSGMSAHPAARPEPPAIQQAALSSGDAWESTLFNHLDLHDLLLTNKGPPLTGRDIVSIIELEERSHFFVSGIEFWPPRQRYVQEYENRGVPLENVPNWGLAKPDLIEIWREDDGSYIWRVIDAKASKDVKTSHLVQTFFYYLCLTYMLPPTFVPAPTVAIWLPSDHSLAVDAKNPSPSLVTLHSTAIAPLVAPLEELLFKRLPAILSSARQDVPWHFNPLCRSCPFSSTCRTRVEVEGGLGKAGEVTLRDAKDVRGFVKLSKAVVASNNQGDIEDIILAGRAEEGSELAQLATLLGDGELLKVMERRWPASVKRVKRILDVQSYEEASPQKLNYRSPVVDAASTNTVQFTNRRIYTLPAEEDIAIFISLIIDPSRSSSIATLSEFCISTYVTSPFQATSRKYRFDRPRHVHGNVESLVPELARCIRDVLELHERIPVLGPSGKNRCNDGLANGSDLRNLPRTQFYVWSNQEREAIQKHLVAAALSFHSRAAGMKNVDSDDIRLCIGALCEGASLLATTFQPHVLEGALLGFLGKKGKSRDEMAAIMRRLGVALSGEEQTAESMRQRIMAEIDRLGSGRTPPRDGERRTVGLLPRVVVLKRELQRLVALPGPGWWDVKEAAFVFGIGRCPDESELFRRYWDGETAALERGMGARNDACQGLVSEIRWRLRNLPGSSEPLVNTARVLNAEWVDVCRVDVLRKLFYMQQFEVLLKLQDLWNSRIEACPEAPVLVFRGTSSNVSPERKAGESKDENKSVLYTHTFDLIAGNLEVAPERDRDRSFFDYLLVEEDDENGNSSGGGRSHITADSSHLPLEALFDDLCVSGLVFPLNRYTRSKWEDGQPREVKNGKLWVADIQDVKLEGRRTEVVLRVWSSQGARKQPSLGKKYRLSPRLVDFNTNKILSTLVELDLQVDADAPPIFQSPLPPFAELITSPKSFGNKVLNGGPRQGDEHDKKNVLDKEALAHRLYTELNRLGNENAGALVLKASQRRAAQRILKERLTVIWGPPGSGKSYTIALSLLRMLEVQATTGSVVPAQRQIIFLTAMTHAAIQACLSKLRKLIGHYRSIPNLSLEWLDGLSVEHVLSGTTHQKPADLMGKRKTRASVDGAKTKAWIYAGTVYQLYTFGKRLDQGVDCIVIDEAGQLGLGAASLVLRALSRNGGMWSGKVVVAGDREQLAPIFAGKYPDLADGQQLLFGSVLDCLMERDEGETEFCSTGVTTPDDMSVGTVVQLLENFRLNPDLGDFVQTIYKRAFKPQKAQARRVAMQLRRLDAELSWDEVSEKSRKLLLALSSAMLGKAQYLFQPPKRIDTRRHGAEEPVPDDHGLFSDKMPMPRPISLALVRLCARGDPLGEMGYESHVRAEAKVAAALVRLLGKTQDSEVGEREDDTFVACPHRVQRAAVKVELGRLEENKQLYGYSGNDEDEGLERLIREMKIDGEKEGGPAEVNKNQDSERTVVVDTIERLQGSEASFVICLFSHTHRGSISTALQFLLARQRLNVAISRAKTLCIVIASDDVLQPDVSVFADRENARGYAFLRAFEERAWVTQIDVDLED